MAPQRVDLRQEMKPAVVLLSAVSTRDDAGDAKEEGYQCFALSFATDSVTRLRSTLPNKSPNLWASRASVIEMIAGVWRSALTDTTEVPKNRGADEMAAEFRYLRTARNTSSFSYALAWAEVIGAHDIFIGVKRWI